MTKMILIAALGGALIWFGGTAFWTLNQSFADQQRWIDNQTQTRFVHR